jgi:hypothetical protein
VTRPAPTLRPPPPILPGNPSPGRPAPSAGSPGAGEALAVLRKIGWPTNIVVLDWETFFSADYHMKGKGSKGLSTIEYIEDRRFEEIGVACLEFNQPAIDRRATFWPGVKEQLLWLQRQYGKNLERATVVIQNARFDGTILTRKHGVTPPYLVDTIALSRHQDARNTHSLADICDRLCLPPKGDTMQFKGKHWETMTAEEKAAMHQYACNDAEREADAFCILLPRMTRPEVELPLARHTLRLFWEPDLAFDQKLAEELLVKMDQAVDVAMEPVTWVLDG